MVCLDLGGPASEVIMPEWGVKVPAHSLPQVVVDLAQAISSLAGNVELRTNLGAAGRRRVEMGFSWEQAKAML